MLSEAKQCANRKEGAMRYTCGFVSWRLTPFDRTDRRVTVGHRAEHRRQGRDRPLAKVAKGKKQGGSYRRAGSPEPGNKNWP